MSLAPPRPPLHCPKCGSQDIISHGKRYAVYPAGCVVVLALPIAWVHRESTPHDFECAACGARFARRTPSAKFAYAALWAAVIIFVVYVVIAAVRAF